MNREYLDIAIHAAKEASEIILECYGNLKETMSKPDYSIVTEADYAADSMITEIILDEFPEHSILSEESGSIEHNSAYLWVIDPIDGTTNFSVNNPFFAISIGLFYRHSPLLGVVFSPIQNELFHAEKNKGAYLNNNLIRVNNELEYETAFISFCNGRDMQYREQMFRIYSKIKVRNNVIRQVGAAALELCYVASGRFGAFIMPGVNPWDVAAGALIIKEAKGIVTDFDNNFFSISSKNIIASTITIHPRLRDIIIESLQPISNKI